MGWDRILVDTATGIDTDRQIAFEWSDRVLTDGDRAAITTSDTAYGRIRHTGTRTCTHGDTACAQCFGAITDGDVVVVISHGIVTDSDRIAAAVYGIVGVFSVA